MKVSSISAVIPVYNSGSMLVRLVEDLCRSLPDLALGFEIILVDDCSQDNSWTVAMHLAQQHPQVRALRLFHNVGQHNATLCGIRETCSDIIVTLDDDSQHSPSEIAKLISQIQCGYDVVYAEFEKRHQAGWRGLLSKIFFGMLPILVQTDMPFPLSRLTSFRAFRSTLKPVFENCVAQKVTIDVLLAWATQNISQVIVEHRKRSYGNSNYDFRRLASFATSVFVNYSVSPLRAVSVIGFAGSIAGLLIMISVVCVRLVTGQVIPGFAFLATAIAFFFSIQFLIMVIFGEYISRIYLHSIGKPQYMVRQRYGGSEVAITEKCTDIKDQQVTIKGIQ